jgi:phage terminase large subunit
MEQVLEPEVLDAEDAELDELDAIPEERALHITTPRVMAPLLQPARYKGAWGGRGTGKSHFFAEMLIERAVMRRTRAVCVREVQRSLGQSVKLLIEDKIRLWGLQNVFRIMNTHIESPHGGVFIFNGMQNHTAESIKSLEGYDIAWVEEAQALSQRSLDLLRPTIRAPGSELWFTWNPRRPTDPIDALLRGPVLPPEAVVVRTSYRDNHFFPDVLRQEMEWDRSRDIDKYQHIWEGEYERHSESRVFKNWTVDEFETPSDSVFYLGGDWGFSVDPTVLVRCFVQGRKLFIDAECYKIGCEIDHIPALFDTLDAARPGMAREWPIIADSARPETISYLKRNGYPRIAAAIKGANSVKEGVIFLQGYDIVIHPRCRHTIDEFTMYSFKTDRLTGMITPVLEDKKNHVIDSVRYAVERLRKAEVSATW